MKDCGGRLMDSAAWTALFTDMDRIADGKMPNGEDIYIYICR